MTTLDMTPGAQIPRLDIGPQTMVTQALASTAYRDGELDALVKLQPDVKPKEPRFRLFRANLGEAFTEAVIARTLGNGRAALVPSFGVDPRMVVEHCLEAQELRNQRDRKLTLVTLLTGVLFLPGTLLWLAAFQLRAMVKKSAGNRAGLYGGIVLAALGLLGVLLIWRPPASGVLGLYLRLMLFAPVIGWFVARRICLTSTEELRARWLGLVEGNALGPLLPKLVPKDDNDSTATRLREQLDRLAAEQETNVLHYAGTKGVLGLGRRWASWHLTGPLKPREGVPDLHAFHPWDLVRRITDRLGSLDRSEVSGGGMPHAQLRQWVVMAVGEGAGEVSRPSGAETMDGPRMRDFAVQNICNEQKFGGGQPRHYQGTQFVLWGGQLVVSLLTNVTVLHNYLRVEVTAYALGPIAGLFNGKPSPRQVSFTRPGRPWKTESRQLPVVDSDEVVRLAVRAPLMWAPVIRDWIGGRLVLPEPFGLRSAWTDGMWTHRFMADDAIRATTPIVRLVRTALDEFLADHDVDVDHFAKGHSLNPGSEAEGVRPGKPDVYDA
ncbi:hypothetical protein ACIQGZ_10035 [Streptomyces sp. NPDC092296]|uniref:hypothetical protein n=1 Tax=Streptomyces sp. NPDC092296 TaxID=3366012 RepID=UPI003822D6E6